MIKRAKGDIFKGSEKGLKVIAFPMGSNWSDGGYLTKKIGELCPDAEKWHKEQRWSKVVNDLGDVQWSMVDYTMAFCLLICRYSKSGVQFDKLEDCLKKLAEGTRSLAEHHGGNASIHMPVLKRGMKGFEELIEVHLADFDVFLYE